MRYILYYYMEWLRGFLHQKEWKVQIGKSLISGRCLIMYKIGFLLSNLLCALLVRHVCPLVWRLCWGVLLLFPFFLFHSCLTNLKFHQWFENIQYICSPTDEQCKYLRMESLPRFVSKYLHSL